MTGIRTTAERFYPGPIALAVVFVALVAVGTSVQLSVIEQAGALTTGFHGLLTLQLALIFWWFLSVSAVESQRIGGVFDVLVERLTPHMTSQFRLVGTTAFVALFLGLINWALGLIVGLFLGRALYKHATNEGIAVEYTAVVVAALSSLILTNQGLSAPVGLVLADDGFVNVLADTVGTAPFQAFLLHPSNIVATGILLVTLPLLIAWLAPSPTHDSIDILESSISAKLTAYTPASEEEWTPADKLENARSISYLAGGLGLLSTGWYFVTGGAADLTWLLFILLMVAIIAHEYPMGFVEKTTNATSWTFPIAIPFLFYAAAFVMLSESGVYEFVGELLVAPVVASYLLSFGVGLLVPDPGSVWLLIAPAPAAVSADAVSVAVASSFGSGVSNFWIGFVFLGLFAPGTREISTGTFLRYAAVLTAYTSLVVLVSLALV